MANWIDDFLKVMPAPVASPNALTPALPTRPASSAPRPAAPAPAALNPAPTAGLPSLPPLTSFAALQAQTPGPTGEELLAHYFPPDAAPVAPKAPPAPGILSTVGDTLSSIASGAIPATAQVGGGALSLASTLAGGYPERAWRPVQAEIQNRLFGDSVRPEDITPWAQGTGETAASLESALSTPGLQAREAAHAGDPYGWVKDPLLGLKMVSGFAPYVAAGAASGGAFLPAMLANTGLIAAGSVQNVQSQIQTAPAEQLAQQFPEYPALAAQLGDRAARDQLAETAGLKSAGGSAVLGGLGSLAGGALGGALANRLIPVASRAIPTLENLARPVAEQALEAAPTVLQGLAQGAIRSAPEMGGLMGGMTAAENWAMNRPVGEGVLASAAQGAAMGFLTGGPLALLHARSADLEKGTGLSQPVIAQAQADHLATLSDADLQASLDQGQALAQQPMRGAAKTQLQTALDALAAEQTARDGDTYLKQAITAMADPVTAQQALADPRAQQAMVKFGTDLGRFSDDELPGLAQYASALAPTDPKFYAPLVQRIQREQANRDQLSSLKTDLETNLRINPTLIPVAVNRLKALITPTTDPRTGLKTDPRANLAALSESELRTLSNLASVLSTTPSLPIGKQKPLVEQAKRLLDSHVELRSIDSEWRSTLQNHIDERQSVAAIQALQATKDLAKAPMPLLQLGQQALAPVVNNPTLAALMGDLPTRIDAEVQKRNAALATAQAAVAPLATPALPALPVKAPAPARVQPSLSESVKALNQQPPVAPVAPTPPVTPVHPVPTVTPIVPNIAHPLATSQRMLADALARQQAAQPAPTPPTALPVPVPHPLDQAVIDQKQRLSAVLRQIQQQKTLAESSSPSLPTGESPHAQETTTREAGVPPRESPIPAVAPPSADHTAHAAHAAADHAAAGTPKPVGKDRLAPQDPYLKQLENSGVAVKGNVSVKIVPVGTSRGRYGVETIVDGNRRYPTEPPMTLPEAQRFARQQLDDPRPAVSTTPTLTSATEPAEPAKTKPSSGHFTPTSRAFTATADGQKAAAGRAGRIVMLHGLNDAVRKLNPAAAYSIDQIDNAGTRNIDKMRDWLVEQQRTTTTADHPQAAPPVGVPTGPEGTSGVRAEGTGAETGVMGGAARKEAGVMGEKQPTIHPEVTPSSVVTAGTSAAKPVGTVTITAPDGTQFEMRPMGKNNQYELWQKTQNQRSFHKLSMSGSKYAVEIHINDLIKQAAGLQPTPAPLPAPSPSPEISHDQQRERQAKTEALLNPKPPSTSGAESPSTIPDWKKIINIPDDRFSANEIAFGDLGYIDRGFTVDNHSVAIARKALKYAKNQSVVLKAIKTMTRVAPNGDRLIIDPNFYDVVSEQFYWTKDYLTPIVKEYARNQLEKIKTNTSQAIEPTVESRTAPDSTVFELRPVAGTNQWTLWSQAPGQSEFKSMPISGSKPTATRALNTLIREEHSKPVVDTSAVAPPTESTPDAASTRTKIALNDLKGTTANRHSGAELRQAITTIRALLRGSQATPLQQSLLAGSITRAQRHAERLGLSLAEVQPTDAPAQILAAVDALEPLIPAWDAQGHRIDARAQETDVSPPAQTGAEFPAIAQLEQSVAAIADPTMQHVSQLVGMGDELVRRFGPLRSEVLNDQRPATDPVFVRMDRLRAEVVKKARVGLNEARTLIEQSDLRAREEKPNLVQTASERAISDETDRILKEGMKLLDEYGQAYDLTYPLSILNHLSSLRDAGDTTATELLARYRKVGQEQEAEVQQRQKNGAQQAEVEARVIQAENVTKHYKQRVSTLAQRRFLVDESSQADQPTDQKFARARQPEASSPTIVVPANQKNRSVSLAVEGDFVKVIPILDGEAGMTESYVRGTRTRSSMGADADYSRRTEQAQKLLNELGQRGITFKKAHQEQIKALFEGRESPDQKFARAESPVTAVHLTDTLKALSDDPTVQALLDNGKLRIVERQAELPDAIPVREGQRVAAAVDPQTGRVYLIAEHFTPAELDGLLHHDVAVHQEQLGFTAPPSAPLRLAQTVARLVGARGVLGESAFPDTLAQLERLRISKQAEVVKAFETAHSAIKGLGQNPAHLKEEAMGYLLGDPAAERLPIVRRVLAATRAFLYRAGFRLDLTPDDLRALARSALHQAAREPAVRAADLKPAEMAYSGHAEDADARRQYADVVARYTLPDGTKAPGWLKAPNGEPTNLNERQWVQARTPAFKTWFGDWEHDPKHASHVVDAHGEPLVVYHGTQSDNAFTTFRTPSFFSVEKPYSDSFDVRGNSLPFFLNIRKMLDGDLNEKKYAELEDYVYGRPVENPLISIHESYDGGTYGDGQEYLVFSENQIKSAISNTGAFSPTNPDIRYAEAQRTGKISPEEDAAYRKAIEHGDQATARRMVDDALARSKRIDDRRAGRSNQEGTQEWANDFWARREVPDGWYVHGRSDQENIRDDATIQLTDRWDVAQSYGYKGKGSLWLVKPKETAKVFDFSGKETKDANRVSDKAWKDFKNGDLPFEDDIINSLGADVSEDDFKEDFKSLLAPKNIVDSAGIFDSDDVWMTWIHDNFDMDFAITPDGAVALKKEAIDAVRVDKTIEQRFDRQQADIRYAIASPVVKAAQATANRLPDSVKDWGQDLVDSFKRSTIPMSMGTDQERALVKDTANAQRAAQFEAIKTLERMTRDYTPRQLEQLWTALDESSTAALKLERGGMSRADAKAQVERQGIGIFSLPKKMRDEALALSSRADVDFENLKRVGMLAPDAQGLPWWTPRIAAMIGDDGTFEKVGKVGSSGSDSGGRPLDMKGINFSTTSPNLRERKHVEAADTESGIKALFGPESGLVRDIRAMPLAMARLEKAIACRELINQIKVISAATGDPETFTIEGHPAFQTYQPKREQTATGKWKTVKDENGKVIFEKKPIYISSEFEGPLRALLSTKQGAWYRGAMALKRSAMSLIMFTPLLHFQVVLGKALPAVKGKLLTVQFWRDGGRALQDPVAMSEWIKDGGLVPLNAGGFHPDIPTALTALSGHESGLITKGIGKAVGLVSPKAGAQVEQTLGSVLHFWHQTLLWDQIAKLQLGMAEDHRQTLLAQGVDRLTATRRAADMANRFVGAMPREAMSEGATKLANIALFSRSWTLGNLSLAKMLVTGLPSDTLAQIRRDAGPLAAAKAVSGGQKLAAHALLTDVALMYATNMILQGVIDYFHRDKSIDQIEQGYVRRLGEAMQAVKENPLNLFPTIFMSHLDPTHDNEPGKEGRIFLGRDPVTGTASYTRGQIGKVGEEYVNWAVTPLDMFRKKLSTLVRSPMEVLANRDWAGKPVYDVDTPGMEGMAKRTGQIAAHLMESQAPVETLQAAARMFSGTHRPDDPYKTWGPLLGMPFGSGYPGGPELGQMAATNRRHEAAIQEIRPDVRDHIKDGDVRGAIEIMVKAGMSTSQMRTLIISVIAPESRLTGAHVAQFEKVATPEERQKLNVLIGQR